MINNLTLYRLPTKYERLKQRAYNLVKEKIIADINENVDLQHLGVDVPQADVEKYAYLIDYLIYAKIQVDTFVEAQRGCLTNEDLKLVEDEYLISCILEEGVCEGYTRDLIDFILDFPLCDEPITYEWEKPSNSCITQDGVNYKLATRVIKKRGNEIIEVYDVNSDITYTEFLLLFPDATQEDYNNRLIEDTDLTCCFESLPSTAVISILNATNNTISISWTDVADSYTLRLLDGLTLLRSVTVTDNSYEFLNLETNKQYSLEIIATNCAGTSLSTTQIATLPYSVNIEVCSNIASDITITGANIGVNEVIDFAVPFTFDFVDSVAPYVRVTSVLINGVENIQNTVFNTFQSSIPTGGTVTIPSIDRNYTVILCGESANLCSVLSVTFDEGSKTLSIS